jgi:hypothetical protein
MRGKQCIMRSNIFSFLLLVGFLLFGMCHHGKFSVLLSCTAADFLRSIFALCTAVFRQFLHVEMYTILVQIESWYSCPATCCTAKYVRVHVSHHTTSCFTLIELKYLSTHYIFDYFWKLTQNVIYKRTISCRKRWRPRVDTQYNLTAVILLIWNMHKEYSWNMHLKYLESALTTSSIFRWNFTSRGTSGSTIPQVLFILTVLHDHIHCPFCLEPRVFHGRWPTTYLKGPSSEM